MKRDMDLMRDILLTVERLDEGKDEDIDVAINDLEPHIIAAHVRLLKEAGFLEAHEVPDDEEEFSHFLPIRLTWSGHEYLDVVRDPEVWRRTKATVAKIGGAGVELIWDLAKAHLKQLLKDKMGLIDFP